VTGAFLGLLTLAHIGKRTFARFSKPAKPGPGGFVLKVPDMTCQHCVATIKGAVEGLPGVRSVSANPGTKLVSLDLASAGNSTAVLQAIEQAGFHPSEVKD